MKRRRPSKPRELHGLSQSNEYKIWAQMVQRCTNPNAGGFSLYGGRGIQVCPQWRDSFLEFLADVGPRPSVEYSLDRINNNGNYEPGNVRWGTAAEQHRNRRDNRIIAMNGESLCMSDWAMRHGIGHQVLRERMSRGFAPNVALTMPVRKGYRGLKGISELASGRFSAAIHLQGVSHYLGVFATAELAAEAYNLARTNFELTGALPPKLRSRRSGQPWSELIKRVRRSHGRHPIEIQVTDCSTQRAIERLHSEARRQGVRITARRRLNLVYVKKLTDGPVAANPQLVSKAGAA